MGTQMSKIFLTQHYWLYILFDGIMLILCSGLPYETGGLLTVVICQIQSKLGGFDYINQPTPEI